MIFDINKLPFPRKIKARGFEAYLVDAQYINDTTILPIYRFPGGDSIVDLVGDKVEVLEN
jgi:hypothetical protein